MSVEIWKGDCTGKSQAYPTEVTAHRDLGLVFFSQQSAEGISIDELVTDEAQAIDIALCILAELAPGMFYNLKKED